MTKALRLTQYSHGAGCGCKIAPDVLETILASALPSSPRGNLVVGHESSDDAAVFDVGHGLGIISTTDFFMPIVDDPNAFGRIAVTNALSDVYAMGGTPIMAIAILGWPLDKLGPEIANQVVEGGRQACTDAGIALAGGHSIDAPEPIFGAAITGTVPLDHLKRNNGARVGDILFLSKALGIGVLTTAEKKALLRPEHADLAVSWMTRINRLGSDLGPISGVHAMTDVTGFGLAGHLIEMCRGADVGAVVHLGKVPVLPGVREYIAAGAVPGGASRNYAAYGAALAELSEQDQHLVCDPQTSGGLLIAVAPDSVDEVLAVADDSNTALHEVGEIVPRADGPLVRFA